MAADPAWLATLEQVGDGDAVAEIERRLRAAPAGADAIAVGEVRGDPVAVRADRQVVAEIGRQGGARAQVEAGEGGIDGRVGGAGDPHRRRHEQRRAVVEQFGVEPDEAVGEFARDIGLELTAALGGEAGILEAAADPVEAAGVEGPVLAERGAVIGVDPRPVEIHAAADADRPAGDVAGLADVIDHRAGRGAGEGGSRSTAHHLDDPDPDIDL